LMKQLDIRDRRGRWQKGSSEKSGDRKDDSLEKEKRQRRRGLCKPKKKKKDSRKDPRARGKLRDTVEKKNVRIR